ncbi:sigma-70 family RNA polymerase sigma factor [Candidatus Woesebacteria bacterium]|nr:sigma-70 family RNA polymerase sigma factor [Candidatus Woesebacteria bacterium]
MADIKKLTDEELVAFVVEKDKEAYGELVKRYQNKLVRYADYLLQDRHIAEDVVQDSFIKAFVNLKGFDVKKKFSSWIYRIVHNESINKINKNRKKISLDANEWIKEVFASSDNVEEDFEKKEMAGRVRACLNKLSLKYRSPLTLFYLEEETYEEISDILRMPVSTVGTRIRRGREKLAEIYKGGEISG